MTLVHPMRRCPKCGALTEQYGHCFVKGPPLFPQMDDDTPTEPCEVVALDDVVGYVGREYGEMAARRLVRAMTDERA